MPRSSSSFWRVGRFVGLWLTCILSGVASGWFSAKWFSASYGQSMSQNPVHVTSTSPVIEIIPVERRPIVPVYPEDFLTRRSSPVMTIVKKASGKIVDNTVVTPDRLLGSAVALTSDGWLATVTPSLGAQHVSDLGVVWAGKVLPVVKAVRDTVTDIVFLKVDASDLPVAAFVSSQEVVPGMAVWLEPETKRLYPETILDVRTAVQSEPISSERASRRFLATEGGDTSWTGGALWDGTGKLVGLLEMKGATDWQVIPADDISSGLFSLLNDQVIHHPVLGVRASDLSSLAFDQGRIGLPSSGSWLRVDRRTGAPAVLPTGPAGSVLREGDVIERVENDILDGTADLGERLLAYRPGATVKLLIRRKDQDLQMSVTLGSSLSSEILK